MNLSQLSVFREVMKTGSMSAAAANLGRTQPAISLSLKALEQSLGITLFDRDPRGLKPVPEAHYLLAEADRILSQMAQLERAMHRLHSGEIGELHLAAMPGVSVALFPRFLARFVADKPGVSLSLHTRSSTQLRELVASQGVDMGFGDHEEDRSRAQQTSTSVICADSFLAMPAAHPLAARKVVPLSALAGVPLAAMQMEHSFQRRLESAFAAAGVVPVIRLRSQIVLPLLQFVAAGKLCAFVDPLSMASAGLVGPGQRAVVFRPIDSPVRYEYATMIPKIRPLSALARQLAEAWETSVFDTLAKLGAAPVRGAAVSGG